MNDLISKSKLRTEIIKLHTKKGYIKRSEVLQLLNNMPCKDNVLVLPCGPNTTVYAICNNGNACLTCDYLSRNYTRANQCINENVKGMDGESYVPDPQCSETPLCEKHFYKIYTFNLSTLGEIFTFLPRFGKTVFLTREEAEEKLKELRGGENE